jgi:hypothetical protein
MHIDDLIPRQVRDAIDAQRKFDEAIPLVVRQAMGLQRDIDAIIPQHLRDLMEMQEQVRQEQPWEPDNLPVVVPAAEPALAGDFHRWLVRSITEFEGELHQDFEVGVHLVSFGNTITFRLRDIGYKNPAMITFAGEMENGDPVQLVQHVSQASVLLIKLQRKDPEQPRRPIGFGDWPNDQQ